MHTFDLHPSVRQFAIPTFSATTDLRAARAAVVLRGELDSGAAAAVEAAFEMARTARHPILIDCARLTFVDVAGLSLLLRAISHHERHPSFSGHFARCRFGRSTIAVSTTTQTSQSR